MASPNARKLKKLLTTRDAATILQGVELAVSLADGALVDELLEGVTYDPRAEPSLPRWMRSGPDREEVGRLVLPRALAPSERQRVFTELGLLGLVSHGSGERAAALRRAITALVVSHEEDEQGPAILDAWLLSGLSALASLRLRVRRVKRLGSLGALQCLRELSLGSHRKLEIEGGLAGLGAAPALRTLSLRARGLESLAGLEGARLDRLTIDLPGLRDLEALASAEVKVLDLQGASPSTLAPLSRCEALEHLIVRDAAVDPATLRGARLKKLELTSALPALALSGLPALEELEVQIPVRYSGRVSDAPVRELELTELPSLRRLHVRGAEKLRVRRLDAPGLDELTLSAHELTLDALFTPRVRTATLAGVTDGPSLNALASARELSLRGSLTSLAPIRDFPALCSLQLQCQALTSLRELPEIHPEGEGGSTELALRRYPELVDLVGIGRYRGLTRLVVTAAYKLTSLRGIEELDGLTALDLTDCSALATLDGLEGARALRVLDLRDCTSLRDVSALASLEELRAVAIHRTPLAKHHFPEAVAWAVTDAASPDLAKLARRSRPRRSRAGRGPVAPELLGAWDEIVARLAKNEVDGAVALLRESAAAAPILDKLLAGTKAGDSWVEPGRTLKKTCESYQGRAAWTALRLLGELSVSTPFLDALRASVTKLVAAHVGPAEGPFDLRWVRAFPALKELSPPAACTNAEGLASAHSLETLTIDLSEHADFSVLAGLTSLRSLALSGAPRSMRGLGALKHLTRVTCYGHRGEPVAELGDLGRCESLRELSIKVSEGCDLGALAEAPCLEELTLDGPADLRPLASASRLSRLHVSAAGEALPPLPRSLRSLRVGGASLRSLGDLESLPALRFLSIHRTPGLAALPALPRALRCLHLDDVGAADLRAIASSEVRVLMIEETPVDLTALACAPALEQLSLRGCRLSDVTALRDAPSLRTLWIADDRAPPDLAPLVDHPTLAALSIAPRPRVVQAALRDRMRGDAWIAGWYTLEKEWTR